MKKINVLQKGFKFLLLSSLILFFSCAPEKIDLEDSLNMSSSEDNIHSMGFMPSETSTEINVDIDISKAISPFLFGVNNDWRQISDARYTPFEGALEQINYQLVRFPGGWESEYYDWSENTTPGWDKAPSIQGASIQTIKETNPAAISIVVPTLSAMNLPQWSPEWYAAIQACKQEATEAITQTGPENILSVEIGNEWWLQWGGGVSRYEKVRKYAHIAKRLARHIRTTFPDASFKLLVNGDYTEPGEFSAINFVFGADLNDIDGLALHTYTGYNSNTHNIENLQENISSCKANLGREYLSLSEWAPSKAYNDNKVYAEGANILVEQIYEHALAGANEAAFWPPVNSSIPGLGLFNYSFGTIYPTAQLFADMAEDFKGEVLKVTDGTVRAAASRDSNGNIVVYVVGKQAAWTTVSLSIDDLKIAEVVSTTLWEPGDLGDTSKAITMREINNPPYILKGKSISFNINENSTYSIYKIVLNLK